LTVRLWVTSSDGGKSWPKLGFRFLREKLGGEEEPGPRVSCDGGGLLFIPTESGGTNLGDADRPELDSEQLPAILRLKMTRVKR
jgi:hypothetical protein